MRTFTHQRFAGSPAIEKSKKREDQGMSKLNIRPLYDRIVVKRKDVKESVKGGIIIPDTAKEKPQEAEVIAVGNGKKTEEGKIIPLDVKAGDSILFGKYSGAEIKLDDQEYRILCGEKIRGSWEAPRHS